MSCTRCTKLALQRFSGFDAIEEEWNRLLEHCWINNPCALPSWQRAWWNEFGQGKEQLLLGYENGGLLKGIASLVRQGGTVSFSGGRDLCDYMDFLVCRGEEEGFYRAFVEFMADEPWKRMELYSIPQDSPTLEYLPTIARETGYDVEVSKEEATPGLHLPGSWDEYLASLTKKDRHELRRKLRRLKKAGDVRVRSLGSPEEVEENVNHFFRLLRESRDEKGRFLDPQRERFFRAVADAAARTGALALFFMEMTDVKVATAMCFDYRGTRFLYNSGFAPEYGYYSVGLLLKALCIQDAIERGLEYFDFMRGAEAYKYHLGAKERWTYQMLVTRG